MLPRSSLSASLTGRVGHAFTAQVMVEGFACHARGVELSAVTSTTVHAKLRSKQAHQVVLEDAGGRLLVGCSCPARSSGRAACRHAWAALLEADRQGALGALRHARGVVQVALRALGDEREGRRSTANGSPSTARARAAPKRKTARASRAPSASPAPPARPGRGSGGAREGRQRSGGGRSARS